jgi:mono/diheme cytochrome c family protein
MKHVAVLTAAFACALPALAQTAKPALYTADQARAGASVYGQSCASCHGIQMEGVTGPALKGSNFGILANAQMMTADMLLDVITSTMPDSDPGTLKIEEYNAVTAYILQQNGYPAGTAPLVKGAAGLADTRITP